MARRILTEGDRLVEKFEVREHWHLFSQVECTKCRERYVRESGWTFNRTAWYGGLSLEAAVCKLCCPCKWSAAAWAKEFSEAEARQRRLLMPKCKPPAPPRMRQADL